MLKEASLLEHLHDHMVEEVGNNGRTATIFFVIAVIFDLIVLAINSASATTARSGSGSLAANVVLVVFIIMTFMTNLLALAAVWVGQSTRQRLLTGLASIYEDHQIEKYYSPTLRSEYGCVYLLLMGVIFLLATTAILVPLIIRFF